MPVDRTVVTVQPVSDDNGSEHTDADAQYLSRAQEELNLNFHSCDLVDGRLVMEYDGSVGRNAQWAVASVAEDFDKVAIVGFNDEEGWANGGAYRSFRPRYEDAQLNPVRGNISADTAEEALDTIEDLLGFRPVESLE